MLSRLALLGAVSLTVPDRRSMRRAAQQRRVALLALLASAPENPSAAIGCSDCSGRIATSAPLATCSPIRSTCCDQTLGDRAIIASGEALQLSRGSVDAMSSSSGRPSLKSAGPTRSICTAVISLTASFVRNAIDFDQWALTERSRLRALAARAAPHSRRALRAAGRLQDALAAAERALELAPGDETIVSRSR